MIFQKRRTAADLHKHAEGLRARADKAEADAAVARSAAATAFADEREGDAQAELARATQLAAESVSLRQAADEVASNAAELEAQESAALHAERVAAADRQSKAARDLIAKLAPRIVKDLRAIHELAEAAEFEVGMAQHASNGRGPDAPSPAAFSSPSVWLHGHTSAGRLAEVIADWYAPGQ